MSLYSIDGLPIVMCITQPWCIRLPIVNDQDVHRSRW